MQGVVYSLFKIKASSYKYENVKIDSLEKYCYEILRGELDKNRHNKKVGHYI